MKSIMTVLNLLAVESFDLCMIASVLCRNGVSFVASATNLVIHPPHTPEISLH